MSQQTEPRVTLTVDEATALLEFILSDPDPGASGLIAEFAELLNDRISKAV